MGFWIFVVFEGDLIVGMVRKQGFGFHFRFLGADLMGTLEKREVRLFLPSPSSSTEIRVGRLVDYFIRDRQVQNRNKEKRLCCGCFFIYIFSWISSAF